MAMYIGECPVYTIMMIGRWSSDAFLRYIRKQFNKFSHNVSRRMIRFQFHRHIHDLEPAVSHLDPRQRNHPGNAETRRNIGGNLSRRVRLPAMSLYNWVNRGTAWDDRIYWWWMHLCAERVRARGETLLENFQEQHMAYPNLFNTCRNIRRYTECRPLVLKPFVTWRQA